MNQKISSLDRRKFLRGTGLALALPWLESFSGSLSAAPSASDSIRRLACFYMPDGVPMPRVDDPAYTDWSWFPHGKGKDFTLTKCLDPLNPLKMT